MPDLVTSPLFVRRRLSGLVRAWQGVRRSAAVAALAAATLAIAPPTLAEVQNPNTHYVQRQGTTMKITDVLGYAAYAGARAEYMKVSGFLGQYNCTIDGRNAQLFITGQYFLENANEACFSSAYDCGASRQYGQNIAQFRDFGWDNNKSAPMVTMNRLVIPSDARAGAVLTMQHPNSPQNWELQVTASERIITESDSRFGRVGPFRLEYFVTAMTGHTVWEGKRYPLSCSRVGMATLRQTVLQRWAP